MFPGSPEKEAAWRTQRKKWCMHSFARPARHEPGGGASGGELPVRRWGSVEHVYTRRPSARYVQVTVRKCEVMAPQWGRCSVGRNPRTSQTSSRNGAGNRVEDGGQ